jgi:hypothetical protein
MFPSNQDHNPDQQGAERSKVRPMREALPIALKAPP